MPIPLEVTERLSKTAITFLEELRRGGPLAPPGASTMEQAKLEIAYLSRCFEDSIRFRSNGNKEFDAQHRAEKFPSFLQAKSATLAKHGLISDRLKEIRLEAATLQAQIDGLNVERDVLTNFCDHPIHSTNEKTCLICGKPVKTE